MIISILRNMIPYSNCSWKTYFTVADIHRNSMFDGSMRPRTPYSEHTMQAHRKQTGIGKAHSD